MARQVLPIVGAIVGAYFGGPAGAQAGYAIGSLVGNAVDPQIINGPRIGDVAAQTSSEGVFQPIYFGTACGSGNMIAQGPNIIKKHKDSGKGGPVTVTQRLYKTFAIRIGVGWNGPITGLSRIWEDEKLVYDIRPGSTILAESTKFAEGFRLYLGTTDQLPDPDLEAIYGIGNTPAYVGRAYIVFFRKDITDRRSISNYRFEVVTSGVYEPPTDMLVHAHVSLSLSANYFVPSADGLDWDDTRSQNANSGTSPSTLAAGTDRYVYAYQGGASYSTDFGVTWVPSTGTFGAGGGHSGGIVNLVDDDTGDEVYLVAGGVGGYSRSTNKGESFTLSATPEASVIGGNWDLVLSIYIFSTLKYSIDQGLSFATGVTHELAAGPTKFIADSGAGVYFGGKHAVSGTPVLYVTSDGLNKTLQTLPAFVDATCVTCLAVDRDTGHAVLGTDSGEIAYNFNGSWLLASDVLGADFWCSAVAFNGDHFTMVGYDLDVPNLGVIKTTTDGNTWTNRPTSYAMDYIGVAALKGSIASVASAPLPLSDIVSAVHGYTKQVANKYDVTELENILVDGLILSGPYTGADSIRTLAGIYFFNSPQIDKQIVYELRGKPVVATLTIDDLVDEPEESTREQAIEYPKKLHLDYQNAAVGYAPAKATSSRSSQDIRVVGEANLQAPVVMTEDLAAQKAVILHKIAWADAEGETVLTVPDNFLWLEAGDCVGLFLRGMVRRLRIDKLEYNPGTIKLTTRNDRQSAYTSNVTGIPLPPMTPPKPSLTGPSALEAMDIPALLDQHDQGAPVRYIAVGGQTEAWYGSQVDESLDGGANNTAILQASSGTLMGTLLNDIPSASEFYTDATNVLQVQMDDTTAEIDSLTDTEFLSEGGAFALEKDDGTWELMQFRDADDLGGGLYDFSHLLRGRLNSAPASHSAGARFVLLDGVYMVSTPSSYIGQEIVHRAISYGTSPETAVTDTITYQAVSQTEFPVANVLLERDVDDILITIVPRYRFGTEDAPVRSVNWSAYSLEVTDGVSLSAFNITTDTYTFDATGMSSPIQVAVAQRNRFGTISPYVSESIA